MKPHRFFYVQKRFSLFEHFQIEEVGKGCLHLSSFSVFIPYATRKNQLKRGRNVC
jgi:hypothetical protein